MWIKKVVRSTTNGSATVLISCFQHTFWADIGSSLHCVKCFYGGVA